jgi:predicted deacylase
MKGLLEKITGVFPTKAVDLGTTIVGIPIVRMKGLGKGPSLLITAGVDGDEYAGMEAAYRLFFEHNKKPFRGNLIIIPIVNIPGFHAGTSENPLDGLFPKYIYPGKKNGKPTERLCWWLSEIAKTADFWLDMHGGASTEILEPFIGSWRSGNKKIDDLVVSVIQSIDVPYAIYDSVISKTTILAKTGCGYLIAESGELGKAETIDIKRHIVWAHQVMSALGMINEKHFPSRQTLFHHIAEYRTHKDGLWRTNIKHCKEVVKKEVIGEVVSNEGHIRELIRVKEEGRLLWLYTGTTIQKGNSIAGIGY